MTDTAANRLTRLEANRSLLTQTLRGIEKEGLRVDEQGLLARTPHPAGLGSALTNEHVTTDYSESLLELITGTHTDVDALLAELTNTHRHVYGVLDHELIWNQSMPATLPPEADIPIAWYGKSNTGMLKHVYRRGLAVRYGKTMQCIAGVHYNFSLAEDLWSVLDQQPGSAQDRRSRGYIGLIRNFTRYSWLLMYLFGAAPALSSDFLRGREHPLRKLDDSTLYLPYATSLRMSDLGYQSNAQAGLTPCYNNLASYTDSLRKAVGTPYPPYVEVGTHVDGEWVQLNTNILQIENEYYSNIRPKRVTYTGERPIQALTSRGVQYVEVRCLDINPFLPVGIDLTEARFLDAFLLFCALEDSPQLDNGECGQCTNNFLTVVKEGRRPGLELRRNGQPIGLKTWASELIERIRPLADLLDQAQGGAEHGNALDAQQAKVDDASLTPSAQVLARMTEHNESFVKFALRQSRIHAETFREQPLPVERQQAFETLARDSLAEQSRLEQQEVGDFDLFVGAYQASILAISN